MLLLLLVVVVVMVVVVSAEPVSERLHPGDPRQEAFHRAAHIPRRSHGARGMQARQMRLLDGLERCVMR